MQEVARILDHNGRPLERAAYSEAQLERIIQREFGYGIYNRQLLKQSAWAYSCAVQTAAQFAQIGLTMWTVDARYEEVTKNPVLDLLKRPNQWQSGFEFKERWCALLLEGGNVWTYMDGKQPNGLPKSLHLLGRQNVEPNRAYSDGPAQSWIVTKPDGTQEEVPLGKMIHSKLPNPYDSVLGLAPMDSLALTLSADRARQIYDEAFFKRNADPTAVLTNPNIPYLDDRQREQLDAALKRKGPQNAGGWIFLGGGWQITPLSFPHAQLQFLDIRKLTRSEIAAAFYGFPVTLLNSEETGGLSRAEHEAARLILIENCTLPQAARFAADFNRFLVEPFDPGVVLEFNTDMIPLLITTQLKTKVEILERGARSGLAPNQLIQMLDLPTSFVSGGDSGYLTSNFVPLELLGGASPAADGGDGDAELAGEGETLSPPQGSAAFIEATPIRRRAEQKIKAALWSIRRAVVQRRGVDDEVPAWSRAFLALSAALYQLGIEQIERDYAGGAPTWLAEVDDPDEAIKALQSNARSIKFGSSRMARECEAHAGRAILALRSVAGWAEEVALRDMDDLPKFMSQLDQVARRMADGFVLGALNAGRYDGAVSNDLDVSAGAKHCQMQHGSGNYSGRPDGTGNLASCGCIVDVARRDVDVRRLEDGRTAAHAF